MTNWLRGSASQPTVLQAPPVERLDCCKADWRDLEAEPPRQCVPGQEPGNEANPL